MNAAPLVVLECGCDRPAVQGIAGVCRLGGGGQGAAQSACTTQPLHTYASGILALCRSPAEGAYSEGFADAKFTQVRCCTALLHGSPRLCIGLGRSNALPTLCKCSLPGHACMLSRVPVVMLSSCCSTAASLLIFSAWPSGPARPCRVPTLLCRILASSAPRRALSSALRMGRSWSGGLSFRACCLHGCISVPWSISRVSEPPLAPHTTSSRVTHMQYNPSFKSPPSRHCRCTQQSQSAGQLFTGPAQDASLSRAPGPSSACWAALQVPEQPCAEDADAQGHLPAAGHLPCEADSGRNHGGHQRCCHDQGLCQHTRRQ